MALNKFEHNYQVLLTRILDKGVFRKSRTGETIALFNEQLTVNLSEGFPMITGRALYFKNIEAEFQWMLSGSTNIAYLESKGVKIWNPWADKDGELGPTYGYQIAKQWMKLVDGIKNDPISRRHVLNLWESIDIDSMALPPCYTQFIFTVHNNFVNMTVVFRSSDAAVGLAYDIPVLGLFLYEAAHYAGLTVGSLTVFLADVHINIENVPAVKEYLKRPIQELPTLVYNSAVELELINYVAEPHIKMIVKP